MYLFVAVILSNGAVDAAGLPIVEVTSVGFEDVEGCFELGKNQDFVTEFEEAGEKGVELDRKASRSCVESCRRDELA